MKVYVYYCYNDIEHYDIVFDPGSLNYITNNGNIIKVSNDDENKNKYFLVEVELEYKKYIYSLLLRKYGNYDGYYLAIFSDYFNMIKYARETYIKDHCSDACDECNYNIEDVGCMIIDCAERFIKEIQQEPDKLHIYSDFKNTECGIIWKRDMMV